MPPSGPTTMTISPRPGTGRSASGPEAASSSTTGTDASRSSPTTWSVVTTSATSGNHERRDCLAASRAVLRHLASALACLSPRQTDTELEAAHGTITSTPTSVSISTASSPRSPFGIACTTTTRGISGGLVTTASTVAVSDDPSVPATVTVAVVPAPSVSATCSPTRIRFTTTACRPSSPASSTVSPATSPARTGWTKTGRLTGTRRGAG